MEEQVIPAQNEQYQSFIIRYNPNMQGPIDIPYDGTFYVMNDLFAVLYVPEEKNSIVEINTNSYNTIPKCYTYMDYEALQASGVNRLQEHPYLRLRGKGTLIAIIDSGIDYRNPLFMEGDKSRILAIWDQTIKGDSSEPVPFGNVYWQNDIEEALKREDPLKGIPSVDSNGHGTMLAALAAGGMDNRQNFSGTAPEASIVVVKLKGAKQYLKDFYLYPHDAEVFQEDDIMFGISFALECAKRFKLPLSICLGIGSNQGAHIGKSPLCQYINYITGFSQNVVSIAAGNEGAARHHYEGMLTKMEREDIVELRIGEEEIGFTMELWGGPLELYKITIQTPTGERLEVSTALKSNTQQLTFVFVETRILVNYVAIERMTGNTLVYFRFQNPAPGIWKFYIKGERAENSRFHIWLPVQGLISEETYFLQPSPYETITSPGDAEDAITVTAYQASDDSFYFMASRGFLPNGTIKPDLAEPGANVLVPYPNGQWGRNSGTSAAAAQNAGISALLFEWAVVRENNPFFNGNNVKAYLIGGTRKTEGRQYPNPEEGFGKTELYRSFELLG